MTPANFGDARLPDRFWSKCMPEPNSGCWLWFGQATPKGYGQLGFQSRKVRRNVYAHRLAYVVLVSAIPNGMQIDHLCRNARCCNPAHLEPVTPRENILRGDGPRITRERHASITHCRQGHPFDEENTHLTRHRDGRRSRQCKQCWRREERRKREVHRAG